MEYYSAIRKDEILPLPTRWMNLENIMLSEISQKGKRQEPYDFTHMWDLKLKTSDQTKKPNNKKS